ncbi:C-type lectin domain family 2 member D11-like isoform X1 [Otolemur garnettii]|uniref:C-type lectin domain family 2 member D11-like isoform X1 n=2 Tax=Otolemur garnettii TaxID=30611 RepID=UPI000C7EC5D8|nr:C-type lectin domain family 2 member D11-like isoform X1 [Otolemur garnettii]
MSSHSVNALNFLPDLLQTVLLSEKIMASETSVKMLQTDPTFRDCMEKGESGKDLQRKCLAVLSPSTLPKVFCYLFISAVLTAGVVALSIVLSVRQEKVVSEPSLYAACPKSWIGFGNKCFHFSEDTRNWTFSQTFCASLESNLAQFETVEELNFLKRYKGPSDHWIGLSRESAQDIWKWTDNTEYTLSFGIRGVGECAYLNDNGISSARIYTDRKWICSKPNTYVSSCRITDA